MKRHLIIITLLLPLMTACRIERAESSNHTEKDLQYYASTMADSRLIFPMVLAETAMSIDIYENMSAEDKIGLTYIFNNLLKTGENTYTMNDFFGLKVSTDGNSINEPGAEWYFESTWGGFYGTEGFNSGRKFILTCRPEGTDRDWALTCDPGTDHSHTIFFNDTDEDNAFYSWEIMMEGQDESPKGLHIGFRTDGAVKRSVYRKTEEIGESQVRMDGGFIVNIYEADMDHLDEISYRFDGIRSHNPHYDF